jgi:hypothetical protein
MFMNKTRLYETLKANGEDGIFACLDSGALLNLALCSKKCYLLTIPTLVIRNQPPKTVYPYPKKPKEKPHNPRTDTPTPTVDV